MLKYQDFRSSDVTIKPISLADVIVAKFKLKNILPISGIFASCIPHPLSQI